MTEIVPVGQERYVAILREEEQRFRSQGLYEAAVQSQRRADIIEQTGDYPRAASYMDRGTCAPPLCHIEEGLLVVHASNGAAALAFTEDRAWTLWCILVEYLAMTPEDLHAAAEALALAEVP